MREKLKKKKKKKKKKKRGVEGRLCSSIPKERRFETREWER